MRGLWLTWKRRQVSRLRPAVVTIPGWRLTARGPQRADRLVIVFLDGRPW